MTSLGNNDRKKTFYFVYICVFTKSISKVANQVRYPIGYHSAVISILISIKVVHSIYCGDPTGLTLKVEQKVKLVI